MRDPVARAGFVFEILTDFIGQAFAHADIDEAGCNCVHGDSLTRQLPLQTDDRLMRGGNSTLVKRTHSFSKKSGRSVPFLAL